MTRLDGDLRDRGCVHRVIVSTMISMGTALVFIAILFVGPGAEMLEGEGLSPSMAAMGYVVISLLVGVLAGFGLPIARTLKGACILGMFVLAALFFSAVALLIPLSVIGRNIPTFIILFVMLVIGGGIVSGVMLWREPPARS